MINVYTSNRLERLAECFCENDSEYSGDVFYKKRIIVQSKGMERWLSLFIAKNTGICANYEFLFPSRILDEYFSHLNEKIDKYSQNLMSFLIIKVLPSLLDKKEFEPVKYYLESNEINQDRKLYQICSKISYLFDQYMIYRPEMIKRWNNDNFKKGEEWQYLLWKNIKNNADFIDRAEFIENFAKSFDKFSHNFNDKKISIFGISALPKYYLDFFNIISENIQIDFYLLNPSPEQYWFDIESEKNREKIAFKTGKPSHMLHLETLNSFLATMGELGKEFLYYLSESNSEFIDLGVQEPLNDNSLLSLIKRDFFELCDYENNGRERLSPDIYNIEFHECFGNLREIEALKDFLYKIFSENHNISADDILVMAPNIEKYSPYIKAVFDESAFEYTISDSIELHDNPVVASIFNIIAMKNQRFEASKVMELLEDNAIKSSFAFTDDEIRNFKNWIKCVNIIWGINDEHLKKLGLPAYSEYTWENGIDRLLSGLALSKEEYSDMIGNYPYTDIEGEMSLILGKFVKFFYVLRDFFKELNIKRSISDWSDLFTEYTNIFYKDSINGYEILLKAFDSLKKEGISAGLDDIYSSDFPVEYLKDFFGSSKNESSFLKRGITFSSLLPMRSIPSKVICLVGMNGEDFPRRDSSMDFDLIANFPKKGDRSNRKTDRYLFLETIISAKDFLYISWTGRSQKDNSIIIPSIVVNELREYIIKNYDVNIEDMTFHHRLHPFENAYFDGSCKLYSYSKRNLKIAEKKLIEISKKNDDIYIEKELDSVEIENLLSFFQNPVKFFVNNTLGIYFSQEEENIVDTELDCMNGLEQYMLKTEFINLFINKGNPIEKFLELRAKGEISPDIIGKRDYYKILDEAKEFFNNISEHFGKKEIIYDIDEQINNIKISGKIICFGNTYIELYPSGHGYKNSVHTWINHILLSAFYPDENIKSLLYWNNGYIEYNPIDKERALEILYDLLNIFKQGNKRPIPFFKDSSYMYYKENLSDDIDSKSFKKAQKSWLSSNGYGESNDEYISIFFNFESISEIDGFSDYSYRIMKPLFDGGKIHEK